MVVVLCSLSVENAFSLLKCTLLLHVITSLFLNHSITVSFIHYDNHTMEEELEINKVWPTTWIMFVACFLLTFCFSIDLYCLPIGLFVIGQKLVNKRFNLDKPARNSLVNQRCIRPNACHNQKKKFIVVLTMQINNQYTFKPWTKNALVVYQLVIQEHVSYDCLTPQLY